MSDADPNDDLDHEGRPTTDSPPEGEVGTGDPVEESTTDDHGRADRSRTFVLWKRSLSDRSSMENG